MFGKQASRFGGNHRPGITIKELLAERILKLVNDARHHRGRNAFPPRHYGETLAVIDGDKQL